MVVRDAFGLLGLWSAIEALDNQVAASVQLRANYKASRLAARETNWLLTRLGRSVSAEKDGQRFLKGISDLRKKVETILPQDLSDGLKLRRKAWVEDGMPVQLANDISLLPLLGAGFDIIKISDTLKVDLLKVAQVYFSVGSVFQLERLRTKALAIPHEGTQIAAATSGLVDSLNTVQADLTAKIVQEIGRAQIHTQTVDDWISKYCPRALSVLNRIQITENLGNDFAGIVVIEQSLRQLL